MFNILVTLQPKCTNVDKNACVWTLGKPVLNATAGSEKSTTFLEG